MEHWSDRLLAASREKQSRVIAGLDPVLEQFPDPLCTGVQAGGLTVGEALKQFGEGILRAVAPTSVAVKIQIAFYEQYGLEGLAAYQASVAFAESCGLLVIGDIKRGDIGSTAEAYALAHLGPKVPGSKGPFEVDAITLNPYLGSDSLEPFFERVRRRGKGAFILARTSNPGARDLQELPAGEPPAPFFTQTGYRIREWGETAMGEGGWSDIGAVVGLTSPEAAFRLREAMPRTLFLVPGYGAQGGKAEDLRPFFNDRGVGAFVAASRSIIYAHKDYPGMGWEAAAAKAAEAMRENINAVIPFKS